MSALYCEMCDRLRDDDLHPFEEWGSDLICGDCFEQHTPEDWEDWRVSYWKKPIPDRSHDWELTHKDYDGAPDSGDARAFTGPTLADVWQQAKDYNEENQ